MEQEPTKEPFHASSMFAAAEEVLAIVTCSSVNQPGEILVDIIIVLFSE